MARSQVDFTLIRYSDTEGTHYFYDPAHPTAIQFLLNGNWESWDVGYVKYKARDPEVKRIAEEAESYLVANRFAGYQQWPYEPPLASPVPVAHVQYPPPPPLVDPSLPSPSVDKYPSPTSQSVPYHHPYSSHQTPLASPQYEHAPRLSPPPNPYYHATYKPQQASDASIVPPLHPSTTSATPYPTIAKSSNRTDNPVPHVGSPSTSLPQVGATSPVLLSRNRETKILLSLDGDGVRGLSQVLLVESLVNAVCTKVGAQIEPYQIFDLIGGCSMGGVFGLMLSRLRMRAQKAREAYKIIAKEVFQNKRDFFTSIDPHAPPLTHDGTSLKNAINGIVSQELGNSNELLYDTRDGSTDVFVIATRIDIGTNKAALMRSYQTRRITGPELDANITVSDAMTASCISPRYLQTQESAAWRPIIEPGVVDHGTAKNNPIRDIVYECRKLYRYTNDMMVIISIGSGQGFDPNRELPEMTKSVHERQVEGGGWGEKFEADHYAHMERGWMKYFRFNVPDLHDVPLEEWCHEERMKDKTLAYLSRPDVGAMFYACVDAITSVLVSGQHQ